MIVHGFNAYGQIEATIDGQRWAFDDDLTNTHRQMVAEWEAEGNTIPPFDPTPKTFAGAISAKFGELDKKRRAVEEGGIMFGNVPLKTDRQTAAIITAAYVKAKDNPAFVIPNWKFADGVFAPLDAATIIAAGDAITAHVQSAFDREAELSAQLMALTTVEDLLAFDVDARWGADPN